MTLGMKSDTLGEGDRDLSLGPLRAGRIASTVVVPTEEESSVRHLGSLALSAVGGAMLYVYLGIGALKLEQARLLIADGASRGSLDLVIGLGLLLAAGIWLTVLLGVRWSPVGLVLLGAALAALGVLAVAAPDRLEWLLPNTLFGIEGIRSAPPAACLAVAVPLLATVFSQRRWRGQRGDQPFSDHPIDAQR